MRRRTSALLAACAASLSLTAVAVADDVPVIAAKPVISGVAQQGATLTASATWTGSPDPHVEWDWRRCTSDGSSCKAIKGASADKYVIAAQDVGEALQVRLT